MRIEKLWADAASVVNPLDSEGDRERQFVNKFAELIIREFAYDVMNVHGGDPKRIQFAAKCWGVEI